jgi:hypothetical protein
MSKTVQKIPDIFFENSGMTEYWVMAITSASARVGFSFGSCYREILSMGRSSKGVEASWMTTPASEGRTLSLDDRFYLPINSMLFAI